MLIHKYVDENVSAATKRSAGVAPEVDLRILLHTGDGAHKLRYPHPGFESQGRHHQKSKTGCHWPHKKD